MQLARQVFEAASGSTAFTESDGPGYLEFSFLGASDEAIDGDFLPWPNFPRPSPSEMVVSG